MRQVLIESHPNLKKLSFSSMAVQLPTDLKCLPGINLVRLPVSIKPVHGDVDLSLHFKFGLPEELAMKSLLLCGAYQAGNEITAVIYNLGSKEVSVAAGQNILLALAYESVVLRPTEQLPQSVLKVANEPPKRKKPKKSRAPKSKQ
jgi:hypothetical protein